MAKDDTKTFKVTESNVQDAPEEGSVFADVYNFIVSTIFSALYAERFYYRYAGEVTSAGVASSPFFGKMSVSKTATGTYKIVHNFKGQPYVIVATPKATAAKIAVLHTKNDNDCTIKIFTDAGVAEDNAFEFALFLYN